MPGSIPRSMIDSVGLRHPEKRIHRPWLKDRFGQMMQLWPPHCAEHPSNPERHRRLHGVFAGRSVKHEYYWIGVLDLQGDLGIVCGFDRQDLCNSGTRSVATSPTALMTFRPCYA